MSVGLETELPALRLASRRPLLPYSNGNWRNWNCLTVLAIALSLACVMPLQGASPVSLGEIRSLLLVGKADADIAAEVQARGVGFQVSKEVLNELRGKGAGAATVAALRAHLSPPVLVVRVQPGGSEIVIDNGPPKRTGSTETTRINGIKPGKHSVIVRKDGFREWTGSVNMTAGEETRLEVTLRPGPSVIEWDSSLPGTTLQVDGKEVNGVVGEPVELSPGRHELVFGCPVCLPMRQEISISPGERRAVEPGLAVDPAAIETLRSSLARARERNDVRTSSEVGEVLISYLPEDPSVLAAVAEGHFLDDRAQDFLEIAQRAIGAGADLRLPVRHRDTKLATTLEDSILTITATTIAFAPLHEACSWGSQSFPVTAVGSALVTEDEASLWLVLQVLMAGEKKPETIRLADRGSELEAARKEKSFGGVIALRYTGRNMISRQAARSSLASVRDLIAILASRSTGRFGEAN